MRKRLYKSRVLLIGDVAHLIHPVAGQGLNLGIRDIESIIKQITAVKAYGIDIGSSYLLKKFHVIDIVIILLWRLQLMG